VIGVQTCEFGCTFCTSVATLLGPIIVAPDVQAYPMTSTLKLGGIIVADAARPAFISNSVSGVTSGAE
jgi:hypothetical protein